MTLTQESLVNLRRDTGTAQEYEGALKEYLVVLDQLQAANPDGPNTIVFRRSKSIALGRLALLVERRGANADAALYMEAAIRECLAVRTSGCLVEDVRKLSAYADKTGSVQVGEQKR